MLRSCSRPFLFGFLLSKCCGLRHDLRGRLRGLRLSLFFYFTFVFCLGFCDRFCRMTFRDLALDLGCGRCQGGNLLGSYIFGQAFWRQRTQIDPLFLCLVLSCGCSASLCSTTVRKSLFMAL